jgi:hypothetical protein
VANLQDLDKLPQKIDSSSDSSDEESFGVDVQFNFDDSDEAEDDFGDEKLDEMEPGEMKIDEQLSDETPSPLEDPHHDIDQTINSTTNSNSSSSNSNNNISKSEYNPADNNSNSNQFKFASVASSAVEEIVVEVPKQPASDMSISGDEVATPLTTVAMDLDGVEENSHKLADDVKQDDNNLMKIETIVHDITKTVIEAQLQEEDTDQVKLEL